MEMVEALVEKLQDGHWQDVDDRALLAQPLRQHLPVAEAVLQDGQRPSVFDCSFKPGGQPPRVCLKPGALAAVRIRRAVFDHLTAPIRSGKVLTGKMRVPARELWEKCRMLGYCDSDLRRFLIFLKMHTKDFVWWWPVGCGLDQVDFWRLGPRRATVRGGGQAVARAVQLRQHQCLSQRHACSRCHANLRVNP